MVKPGRVTTRTYTSHGMVRTEALCRVSGTDLGRAFPAVLGPPGLRYCISPAALDFAEREGWRLPGWHPAPCAVGT